MRLHFFSSCHHSPQPRENLNSLKKKDNHSFSYKFYLTPSSVSRTAFSVSFSLLARHCFSSCLPGFKIWDFEECGEVTFTGSHHEPFFLWIQRNPRNIPSAAWTQVLGLSFLQCCGSKINRFFNSKTFIPWSSQFLVPRYSCSSFSFLMFQQGDTNHIWIY